MRSTGVRFLIVGCLALLMSIPLFFAGVIIDDRASYARSSVTTVSAEWGGAQSMRGPQLSIPVEGPMEVEKRREVVDPETGDTEIELFTEVEIRRLAPLVLLPDDFTADIATTSEIRKRGIFEVPVYSAESAFAFTFATDGLESLLDAEQVILWDLAQLDLGLSSNKALRGAAGLSVNGSDVLLQPRTGQAGITALVGDPRGATYQMQLGFNGAQSLFIAPVGRANTVTMTSDWPHPSFGGEFLPNESEITNTGFTASWSIPGLARPLPQVARNGSLEAAERYTFGVRFYQPNDFYQQSFRAARYGLLFIGLTFLTVLLVERQRQKPTHPVQYILIGLAQSTFVLLMVAYAEQIGFGYAYLLAAVATTGLITLYGFIGLKLGQRAWVLGGLLTVLYAVLYLILRSADYALLFGATLAFSAIAATMIATKDEEWYGDGKDQRKSWFGNPNEPKKTPEPEQTVPPRTET